jgi:hypothetical protein
MISLWIYIRCKSEICNNIIKELFSLFYDVLVLNFFKQMPLSAQASDTALVSGERRE